MVSRITVRGDQLTRSALSIEFVADGEHGNAITVYAKPEDVRTFFAETADEIAADDMQAERVSAANDIPLPVEWNYFDEYLPVNEYIRIVGSDPATINCSDTLSFGPQNNRDGTALPVTELPPLSRDGILEEGKHEPSRQTVLTLRENALSRYKQDEASVTVGGTIRAPCQRYPTGFVQIDTVGITVNRSADTLYRWLSKRYGPTDGTPHHSNVEDESDERPRADRVTQEGDTTVFEWDRIIKPPESE